MKKSLLVIASVLALHSWLCSESFSISTSIATGFFETGVSDTLGISKRDLENANFSSDYKFAFHRNELLGAGIELDLYNQFHYMEEFDGTITKNLLATDPVVYLFFVSKVLLDVELGIGVMAPSLGFADDSYVFRIGDSFILTLVPALRLSVGAPIALTKQLFLVPYVRVAALGVPGVTDSLSKVFSALFFDHVSRLNTVMHVGFDLGVALEIDFE